MWHHFLASWDVAAANCNIYIYIDDVSQISGTPTCTPDADNDYTRSQHYESGIGGSQYWDGCLADLYINYSEALDLSVTANRRKFTDVNGDPSYLGATGTGPTGSQPIVLLQGTDGTNSGSGGNYTSTSVGSCSTAP